MDKVKGLPVTTTETLGSNMLLEIGSSDMELKPSIYYAPVSAFISASVNPRSLSFCFFLIGLKLIYQL